MAARPRYVNVLRHVQAVRPDIGDPVAAIEQRRLVVGGRIVLTTSSLVREDAPVMIRPSGRLRGESKLEAALDGFGVVVAGRTCLDLGASAGGFTRVLLARGAGRVFAVDAGHGQLRGDLRTDPRVVDLERTNLADVSRALPEGDVIDVVTIDLSYLSIADAVPQLERVAFARRADLIALVKPMFELAQAAPPAEAAGVHRAVAHAAHGIERTGTWEIVRDLPSPAVGGRGAREWLLHARRIGPQPAEHRGAGRGGSRRHLGFAPHRGMP